VGLGMIGVQLQRPHGGLKRLLKQAPVLAGQPDVRQCIGAAGIDLEGPLQAGQTLP
jgi:hypothetical protein